MYLPKSLACLLAVYVLASAILSAQRLDSAAFITAATAKSADDVRPWTVHENIAYGTDREQVMDILVPKTPGTHTTIILIHGGGWYEGDKKDMDDVGKRFALKNYTVANINYRLATATGNHYPAGIDDCRDAVGFVVRNAEQYGVNVNKIAALGTSAGGNLALQLGLTRVVSAVVDFYGPTNFVDPVFLQEENTGQVNSDTVANYFGCSFTQNPALYFHASPINEVTKNMAPTLILQGELDTVVPAEQSIDFYQALEALGVTSTLHMFPTLGHGFLNNSPSPDAFLGLAQNFLNRVFDVPAVVSDSAAK